MIGFVASVILAALTPEAPFAADAAAERINEDYAACIRRIEADVEDGRTAAERWVRDGGGPPARHCLAVADLAAGRPKLAAVRLVELAERTDAGDGLVRARIFAQAAIAWLEANALEEADAALARAFDLAPGSGELRLVEAEIAFARDEMQATVDAVDAAEAAGAMSGRAHVLRGKALHALARHREAAEDAIAALQIDPFDVDALVLRGDLARAGVSIDARYQRADQP